MKVSQNTKESFFDLSSFVEKKVAEYQSKNCSLFKMGEVNGESAQSSIPKKDIEWDKEFKILKAMDINKSSWYDYFKIDTLQTMSEDSLAITEIIYTTNSSHIPIKSMKLSYYQGKMEEPFLIEAERISKNWIFSTQQKVIYADAGLRAEGSQKILWMKEKFFNITVIFNCQDESN